MLRLPSVENKRIAVLGLGKSGMAAARALAANGARVVAWDDDPEKRHHAECPEAMMTDLNQYDFSGVADLVLSPGIPLDYPAPHPVVTRARQAGCRVIGETELLARCDSPAQILGITGTNGKSTTTALITHILKTNGIEAAAGGNFGTPTCQLPSLPKDGVYVLEMSSYQLDLLEKLVFDIAIFLNLSADHLDRHGGMEGYVAAKEKIFRGQTASAAAIIGIDDPSGQRIHRIIASLNHQLVIPISARHSCSGGVYSRQDGWLIDDVSGDQNPICDLNQSMALKGRHNGQNAAAAFAACRIIGLSIQDIANGLNSFPGLPHRQESIANIAGVDFINDSKATNPESSLQALMAYRDIYWIVGGRAKKNSMGLLEKYLKKYRDHVRKAYLIGEASASLAAVLDGKITAEICGDLAVATRCAFIDAQNMRRSDPSIQPVVLLSPACASFDQWQNFEERGDAFRALVWELSSGKPQQTKTQQARQET